MMKILVLTHTYPTKATPWVTPFVAHFSQALAAHPGIEVHVILPTVGKEFLGDGVIFHPFEYSGRIAHKGIGKKTDSISRFDQLKYIVAACRKVSLVCQREKIDLVHAHWSIPSGLVARLNRIWSKTPYVVTTHGRDVLDFPEVGYAVPSDPILGPAVSYVLAKADGVIVTSPITEEAALKLSPKAKTYRIPVGLSSEFIGNHDRDTERNGIVAIGDFVPRKGIDRLIEAVARSEILRRTPVSIIGDGPERQNYEKMCKSLALENISFLGFVPPRDLPAHLERAEVCAFLSHIEAFGIVLLEALSAGLIVAGASTGALPMLKKEAGLADRIIEVCGVGEHFLRGLVSGLERALECKSELSQQSKDVLLSKYTWESIAESHIRYFEDVIVRSQSS
jgi:glycosyltransferase involved in cell wall biosynthesis